MKQGHPWNTAKTENCCVVKLDRLQLVGAPRVPLRNPPQPAGYKIASDKFVRCQTTTSTYARCRTMLHERSGTQVFWQYQRCKGWLDPWKVTFVANDFKGLERDVILPISEQFKTYRPILVEIAFDFDATSPVDELFVQQYGQFGKSRQTVTERAEHLRYGTRKSAKLVRCYEKTELSVYRVELELHSSFLQKHQVTSIENLQKLHHVLLPKHICFCQAKWHKLKRYLVRRFGRTTGDFLWSECRRKRERMASFKTYLRGQGVPNVQRFTKPRKINKEIRRALKRWERRWKGEE
jgi:hypothetical protein